VNRRHYALHRWLGAVIGIQLFLWCLGGFVFAVHDMDVVRGVAGMRSEPPPELAVGEVSIAPSHVAAARTDAGELRSIELRELLGQPVYEVRYAQGAALVDPVTGELRSPIDEATAVKLALADREGDPPVVEVSLVAQDPPVEYRGGPLPAWRVTLEDGNGMNLWIAADTGRVAARRNDTWRRFDFFWMLHTMDYRGRDDFNHPLLVIFASLGLLTVVSGGTLWGLRVHRRLKRRLARGRRERAGQGQARST
jgi:uncharacterized iron-regulated membrane protein